MHVLFLVLGHVQGEIVVSPPIANDKNDNLEVNLCCDARQLKLEVAWQS
jgi:hypothetical protein